MEDRRMALREGTSRGTIQKAIDTLNAEGQAYAGKFGKFSTKNIKVTNSGTFAIPGSEGSTPYVMLTVKTASKEAFDALFDELNGIDLESLDFDE